MLIIFEEWQTGNVFIHIFCFRFFWHLTPVYTTDGPHNIAVHFPLAVYCIAVLYFVWYAVLLKFIMRNWKRKKNRRARILFHVFQKYVGTYHVNVKFNRNFDLLNVFSDSELLVEHRLFWSSQKKKNLC